LQFHEYKNHRHNYTTSAANGNQSVSGWVGLGIAGAIAATMTYLWNDQTETHAKEKMPQDAGILDDVSILPQTPKKIRKV
jgi:hypothetical protein